MAKPTSPQNTNLRDLDPLVKDSSTYAIKRAVVTRAVAGVDYVAGDIGVATHADDTAFTPAADPVVAIGAIADETATDSVDEGDVGAVRMTLDRRLITSSEVNDDAAFVAASKVSQMGALVDDTSTDQADEGDVGIPRMTPNRELRTTAATGAPTDKSGAITTGATSQTLAAANANRKYIIIQNISAEDMWFRWDGSAATADKPSIKLATGQSWENPAHWCPTAAITVIAATTGSKFTAWEA